jgi:preprotein translocase subunit SecE
MNAKVSNSNSPVTAVDIAKYALAVLVAIGGIVAYYWFADMPGALRALLPFAGLVAGGAIFAFTAKGRDTAAYLAESRFELRKVIWPTRQETIRATGVILVVVVVMSLLLGLIDFILGGGIKLLLGS